MNGKRPKGCDDQGRFPEAAEACSDILIDEDERDRYRYRSGGKEMAGLEWFIWAIVLGIVLLVVILTMMGVPV
jgi:hypothetical protein